MASMSWAMGARLLWKAVGGVSKGSLIRGFPQHPSLTTQKPLLSLSPLCKKVGPIARAYSTSSNGISKGEEEEEEEEEEESLKEEDIFVERHWESSSPSPSSSSSSLTMGSRRKHMCYYFTQGLCKMMEDPTHLAKFSHSYPDFDIKDGGLKKIKPQPFTYFLVLDLEGKLEILEFPVVMVDASTLEVVDRFHKFVRPVKLSKSRIEEYIDGKYGRWGLDRVWHDTAIPFTEVLEQFESWLENHGLWEKAGGGKLKNAAFVTCGNWDVKTKIPEQCIDSRIKLPSYFFEWINLKDVYLNFYQQRAGGMMAMLKGLKIPLIGTHHVGLDDANNITRVLQRMLIDGALIKITAARNPKNLKDVQFMFRNRVK